MHNPALIVYSFSYHVRRDNQDKTDKIT